MAGTVNTFECHDKSGIKYIAIRNPDDPEVKESGGNVVTVEKWGFNSVVATVQKRVWSPLPAVGCNRKLKKLSYAMIVFKFAAKLSSSAVLSWTVAIVSLSLLFALWLNCFTSITKFYLQANLAFLSVSARKIIHLAKLALQRAELSRLSK